MEKAPRAEKVESLREFRRSYPALDEFGLTSLLEHICQRHLQAHPTVAEYPLPAGAKWVVIEGGLDWLWGYLPEYGYETALDGKPRDRVFVHGYEMLKTEVTSSQYQACVMQGACSLPRVPTHAPFSNYGLAGHENHPVNYVNWNQAEAFCEWIGGRLPSEVELYSAIGSRGKYSMPWGNSDDCDKSAKFQVGKLGPICGSDDAGTSAVCSRPSGNSEQGLCDLVGNVAEWAADTIHPTFCGVPSDGSVWGGGDEQYRIVKGGSWRNDEGSKFIRPKALATQSDAEIGFRCVRDR